MFKVPKGTGIYVAFILLLCNDDVVSHGGDAGES